MTAGRSATPASGWCALSTCERCGQEHARCKAHNRDGDPCGHMPAKEQAVCRLHGGSSGQALAKAEERRRLKVAEGEMGKLLADMGQSPYPHPLDGLEDTYATAGRMVAALKVLVAELETPLGRNRFEEQVIHPLVALYGEWLDRYARVQKIALDAGLDQRRQAMAEHEVAELFDAVNKGLDAAGLTPEQRTAFTNGIAGALRAG